MAERAATTPSSSRSPHGPSDPQQSRPVGSAVDAGLVLRRRKPRIPLPQVYVLASVLAAATYLGHKLWAPQTSAWSLFWRVALAAYLPSFFDGAEYTEQGRYWKWFATHRFWRWFYSALYPGSVDFSRPLDAGRQYIVSTHPHGVYSMHHLLYLTNANFQAAIPGVARRHVGANIVFKVPLLREIMLWTGVIDGNRPLIESVLKQGSSLVAVTGGIAEQTRAAPGDHTIIVWQRKGIFELSLKYGVPIVPSYCFGELELASTARVLQRWRNKLSDQLRIPLPISWGVWGSFVPYFKPLRCVLGQPLDVTPIESPTPSDIATLQQRYIAAMQELFDSNKKRMGCPDAQLHVAEPSKGKNQSI